MENMTVFYTKDSVKITTVKGLVFLNEKDIFSHGSVFYQVIHKFYDTDSNSIVYKGKKL